jgi:hypothetical protein
MSGNAPSVNPLSYGGVLPNNPTNLIKNNRAPNSTDINANIGDEWEDYSVVPSDFWKLANLYYNKATWILLTSGAENLSELTVDAFTAPGTNPVIPFSGNITITGGQVAAGTTANVIITDSLSPNTFTIQVQRSEAVASSTIGDNGVCHFNSADFSVDANGFVSILDKALNYTNVTHAQSPYTILSADYYISVDCSLGPVELLFPNAPTFKEQWIIKDRTGSAATNNITLTTPGGTVTFDGLTTYTMNSNYESIQMIANATPTYEVY